ncbi:MAG TPA: MMPL family transporter [Saprospiraceae bacterium]|nr:MMPL family transporter [Saprospiraceae bacterium]HNN69567.1 MMPL family transporter [Saprospiraceae bacterium]
MINKNLLINGSLDRWIFIIVVLVIGTYELIRLRIEFNPKNFYAKDLIEVQDDQEYQQKFRCIGNDNLVLAVIYSEGGIFRREFLQSIEDLTNRLTSIDGVAEVSSITHSKYYKFYNGNLSIQPVIHFNDENLFRYDSIELNNFPDIKEKLITSSGKGIVLGIIPKSTFGGSDQSTLIKRITEEINSNNYSEHYLTGLPVIRQAFSDELKSNLFQYSFIASILMILLLLYVFKNIEFTGVIFAIVCVPVAIMTVVLRLLKMSFDPVMINAIPLLLMLSLSGVIHFILKFKVNSAEHNQQQNAFSSTIKEMLMPIWLTGITTGAGFFSLWTFDIPALSRFGIICGLTAMLTIFTQIIFLKWYLQSANAVNSLQKETLLSRLLERSHSNGFLTQKLFSKAIISMAVIASIAFFYSLRLEVNGSILDGLGADHPIRRSVSFLDSELKGTMQMELECKTKNGEPIALKHFKALSELGTFLQDSIQLNQIISPVIFLKAFNRAWHNNNPGEYRVQNSQIELDRALEFIEMSPFATHWDCFYSINRDELKISGRYGSSDLKKLIQQRKHIQKFWQESDKDSLLTLRFRGPEYLTEITASSMGDKLPVNFIGTILVIYLILLLSWRKWMLAGIALIPVLFSMLVLAGFMGFLSIPIKPDTAFIFSVMSGITVDNSIHLISHFRRNGMTIVHQSNHSEVFGNVILHSGLVCLGLVPLLLSGFMSVFHFGLMGIISILCSLFVNIYVIPIILSY